MTPLSNNENSVDNTSKSPMKMVVFLVLGALVLYLGYVLVFKKDSLPSVDDQEMTEELNSESNTELGYDPENSVDVTLNEQFSPQTVTLKVGQSVTWTNKSGSRATVNSSPHPEHTDNPLLNLGEFESGDSLTLVFTESGTFRYHNHLDSTQFGTITVEE